ncbi:MAG: serine hydrolase domain-containing protein [bacterium]
MIICLLIVMSVSASAVPQNTRQSVESTTSVGDVAGRFNTKEIEAFFDVFFTKHVAESEFPSAAVVLVEGDHIHFLKGYGYTDLRKTESVSADKTVFYAASVSKLFVATAVMQLAEQGKLNLNDDVNKYLNGFQLDNSFPRPVTLADLLTHTGGLDDHMLGSEIPITDPPMPLGEYFDRYTPPRVLPPRDQINYSNHGMALAGYVVETVSGMTFCEYVERNIFAPLGMKHSSFRQPVTRELKSDIGLERFPKPQTVPYPVATLVSTAEDMGRFMLAHLNGGRLGGLRILQEASVAEMHCQHFTNHPHMPGVAYGFFESFVNGQHALFHTGARDHFSLLYLLPAEKVGLYIVIAATEEESRLITRVLQAFLDRYYPSPEKDVPVSFSVLKDQRTNRFSGFYRMNMIPHKTIEKLAAMAMDVQVLDEDGGTLSLNFPAREQRSVKLFQVEPLLFRAESGGYAAFREDTEEHIINMFLSGVVGDKLLEPTSFDKLYWYESGKLHAALATGGFLIFLLFPFLAMGIHLFARWRKRSLSTTRNPGLARAAWRTALLVSVLVILGPASGIMMAVFTKEHQLYNLSPILYTVLSFLMLASVSGLALPVFAIIVWKHRYWSLGERLLFSLMALTALGMIPFLSYWNSLGFYF